MSILPKSLLLDTNVWLDNYIGARPSHAISRRLISFAMDSEIALLYQVTSLKDVYYNIAQSLKNASRDEGVAITHAAAVAINEVAYASVKNMADIGTAVGADGSDVWLALKLYSVHRDIEDDMILAAMERSGASFLVTNDLELIRHASCAAMTSEDMLGYLEAFNA